MEFLSDVANCVAYNSRLVVPLDMLKLDRAEHTTATLYSLKCPGMMEFVIVSSSFPIIVSPYFCTIQGTVVTLSNIEAGFATEEICFQSTVEPT